MLLQGGWGLLGLGVDDVRMRLLPDVVAEQAEMFLINGDMQSNLYTSSRAMHSAILGLLQVPPLSHIVHIALIPLFASAGAVPDKRACVHSFHCLFLLLTSI